MFGITPMLRSVNRHENTQSAFGGYDHRDGAGEGAIWDCLNMSADKFPLLTCRQKRSQYDYAQKPNGLLGCEGLCWVDGTKLMIDKKQVGTVRDSPKIMCSIQGKICIWPDAVMYDRQEKTLTNMEQTWYGEAYFGDGTYAGEPATANTIRIDEDLRKLFRTGDGVQISVGIGDPEKEPDVGGYIIREMEYIGGQTQLRFYENTWDRFAGTSARISIWRRVPVLDVAFEHHNRIWGAAGNRIYACALGDPTNWQIFDGLSTDAYELETDESGRITGGFSYGGRPIFFKEREVIKIYGDRPSSWQISRTQCMGVEKGSGKSLAVAGNVLFYKSGRGIMAYSGGYPQCVSEELGGENYCNATAGSDGTRYYVDMERVEGGNRMLFCYDTRSGLWHRENTRGTLDWAWAGSLYGLDALGRIWKMSGYKLQEGEDPTSGTDSKETWVEFGDWTDGTLHRKRPGKLMLRMRVGKGTRIVIKVRYDSGTWTTVKEIVGDNRKEQFEIPVQLRRCDHYRLRIEGTHGEAYEGWTLHAIAWARSVGSARK